MPAQIIHLTTLLGVDCCATSRWWLNLPLMVSVWLGLALIFAPTAQLGPQIFVGIVYGLLIILSSFCHGLGHIINSRLVKAPMTSLYITATVGVTHYEDDTEQPGRVHLGRALGGPLFNLFLGLSAIALYLVVAPSHFLLFFGIVNLGFGVFTLMPIPSLDGAVIWHELLN